MPRPHVNPSYRPTESEVSALERRYVQWATRRGLAESLATNRRFAGRIGTREVTFVTGLGGTSPLSPQIVVDIALDAPRSILLTGAEALESPVEEALAELLPLNPYLRNVGLTKKYVRLTFETGTETAELESVLDALEERLRALEPRVGSAYR